LRVKLISQVNPPAYSESHRVPVNGPPSAASSTLLGTVPQNSTSPVSSVSEKPSSAICPTIPEEKRQSVKDESVKAEEAIK
jgi:hypothetical protein